MLLNGYCSLNIFNAEKSVVNHVKEYITSLFFNRIKFCLAVKCERFFVNKAIKFLIKILNGCWESSKKLYGATFLPHAVHTTCTAQSHSRSSMLITLKSTSPELVMISSMSVPICNCFHASQGKSGKNSHFLGGTPVWHSYAQASLNAEDQDLDCWNIHFMLKIWCAGSLDLFPQTFWYSSLLKCVSQPEITKKSLKPSILEV